VARARSRSCRAGTGARTGVIAFRVEKAFTPRDLREPGRTAGIGPRVKSAYIGNTLLSVYSRGCLAIMLGAGRNAWWI
jgi:hypothetical protein